MDFQLTTEQEMIRDMTRDFTDPYSLVEAIMAQELDNKD